MKDLILAGCGLAIAVAGIAAMLAVYGVIFGFIGGVAYWAFRFITGA